MVSCWKKFYSMLWTIFTRIRYRYSFRWNKIFGIDIVKNVMNRKYSRGKQGMMLISEAMLQIVTWIFKRKQWKTAKCSTALPASTNSTKYYYVTLQCLFGKLIFWNMQALRRAIPLFYAFDRINYKRWAPLYYEDCLALPNKFPKLYEPFSKGDFVVTQTFRKI